MSAGGYLRKPTCRRDLGLPGGREDGRTPLIMYTSSPSYNGCPIPDIHEVPLCRSSRNLCYGSGVARYSRWMVIDEYMEKTMLFVRCCWFSRLCAEGKLTLWLQSPGYGSLRNYRVQRFGLTRYKGDTVVDWVPQQYFLIVLCTLINPDSLSTTDRQRLGDCVPCTLFAIVASSHYVSGAAGDPQTSDAFPFS